MFETGKVVNYLSGYEEYPGSFLFYGLLFQLFPPYLIMEFFIPFFFLVGAVAIYLLFKRFFDTRLSFLVSVLYLFFNWTVEDNHLSPQFLVLNLYFVFMLILVKFLGARKKDKNSYLPFLFLLIPVIVFSHPGTPIFLILILGSMLLLCKRVRSLKFLSVFLFLVLFFMIYNYYLSIYPVSFLRYIRRFLDVLLSREFSGTTERLTTTFPSRMLFLYCRMGITIFSFIIGSMGIYLLRKRGHKNESNLFVAWAFSMLLFTIFVSLGLKGQYYERLVLISSLPLAAVGAYFIDKSKIPGIMILIMLLVITPLYFIAKYGNEGFESLSLEKLKAECFSHNLYDDCYERQEIVKPIYIYNFEYFGSSHFTVSMESILATSLRQSMRQTDVITELENIALDKKLDKIYSSDSATVYK